MTDGERKKREEFCTAQIKRLQGLDFFPAEPAARGELIRVLVIFSDSNEHAERIIDAVLTNAFGDNGRCCPTPFELTDLARGIDPAGVRKPVAWAECPLCFGSGWATVEYTPSFGAFSGIKYHGVKPCACKTRVAS